MRSRSQGGSPAIMTIGRADPSRMTSSGVKRDRPWMCCDRLAVSKRIVR
jgi:hypothetical protein